MPQPENVVVTADGTSKLCDFGLAIDLSLATPVSRVGTLEYMSPEIVRLPRMRTPEALEELRKRKEPPYDNKVDVWALGCLMYVPRLPPRVCCPGRRRCPRVAPSGCSPSCDLPCSAKPAAISCGTAMRLEGYAPCLTPQSWRRCRFELMQGHSPFMAHRDTPREAVEAAIVSGKECLFEPAHPLQPLTQELILARQPQPISAPLSAVRSTCYHSAPRQRPEPAQCLLTSAFLCCFADDAHARGKPAAHSGVGGQPLRQPHRGARHPAGRLRQ